MELYLASLKSLKECQEIQNHGYQIKKLSTRTNQYFKGENLTPQRKLKGSQVAACP